MKVARNTRADRPIPQTDRYVLKSLGKAKGSTEVICKIGKGIHKIETVIIPIPVVNAFA